MKVNVLDIKAKKVGEMELNDAVFGVEYNEALIHQVVVAQLDKQKTRYQIHFDPYGSQRRRQEALETERHRSRKTGKHQKSAMDGRRRSICSQAQRFFSEDKQEDESSRYSFRAQRKSKRQRFPRIGQTST